MNPRVTFIVPCYKLAHLLPQCIQSILSQSFRDFEILVMDDCSPDDTPGVARSFGDERVKHVRNEPNLGHLRNYNKGIGMARGEYIWLISADDYLRSPDVLDRYVKVLDAHPKVGYAFCAGMGVLNGREAGPIEWAWHSEQDRLIAGHDFLQELLIANRVVASSGIVRRECYETVGDFPLDMPYAGDWYLWCAFALFYDVAYFGEPMVCYRLHDLAMTSQFNNSNPRIFFEDDQNVLWGVMQLAEKAGANSVVENCRAEIVKRLLNDIRAQAPNRVGSDWEPQLEGWIRQRRGHEGDKKSIGASVFLTLADEAYWRGEAFTAKRLYRHVLGFDPWCASGFAKYFLLHTGGAGDFLRRGLVSARRSPAEKRYAP